MLDFSRKPIIGMVHLGALPGSARYGGDLAAVIRSAVADAQALEEGGADGVMVENFFDAPFHKSRVPPITIAAMTAAALAIRETTSLPLGVNVLRNDVESAIAIAAVCGGAFVRCNVYVGAAVTDQGIIEGAAREAVAARALAPGVRIWADVGVKHARILGDVPLAEQARDAVERGLADALIVTGVSTGSRTDLEDLRAAKSAVPTVPVLVGSGLSSENGAELLSVADGAIVGSSLKSGGRIDGPIDPDLVRALLAARG